MTCHVHVSPLQVTAVAFQAGEAPPTATATAATNPAGDAYKPSASAGAAGAAAAGGPSTQDKDIYLAITLRGRPEGLGSFTDKGVYGGKRVLVRAYLGPYLSLSRPLSRPLSRACTAANACWYAPIWALIYPYLGPYLGPYEPLATPLHRRVGTRRLLPCPALPFPAPLPFFSSSTRWALWPLPFPCVAGVWARVVCGRSSYPAPSHGLYFPSFVRVLCVLWGGV